uniref:Uncharacterized protein n=1 Tax=Rhizophora mucronata TaxID=61149 RepID=A0A2P2NAL0_RHIMU
MRRWSLRSLPNTKMKTQQKRPIAEMLRRYWMLPYQASPSPAAGEEGGWGRGGPMGDCDLGFYDMILGVSFLNYNFRTGDTLFFTIFIRSLS